MIHILIVDDQYLIRQTLEHSLNREDDFKVVGVAENGIKALIETERLEPDVIIMDINMPEMDGFEATEAITFRFPDIKIISLSANDTDYLKALYKGAKTHVTKDNNSSHLMARIREVYHEIDRNSLTVKYQLKERSHEPTDLAPLNEISLSTLKDENIEIINAQFQTISEESNMATVEGDSALDKPNDSSEGESNSNESLLGDRSYYKSGLERATALIERTVGDFEAKYLTLISKYNDIGYEIRGIVQKNERLLIKADTILQENKSRYKDTNQSNTIYLEDRLVRLGDSLTHTQKQIQLVIKLCVIAISLIIFSLISFITYIIL